MSGRRERGDGSLYWHEGRQRWIASVSVGFKPNGKRKKRERSAKTKTAAKAKLRDMLRDVDDGIPIAPHGYTVGEAVKDWLRFGLAGRDPETVTNRTILANKHVIPALGRRKLRELTADDVDEWLESKADDLATDTLARLMSILRRSITRAQARDKVKRNVALLCELPKGREGRPSKALNLEQAASVLAAAEGADIEAYVVVSLLTGARTEELRPLTWSHVDLIGVSDAEPPVPPSIQVWRSVRADGDTKTEKSRRTLQLPARCVDVLKRHRAKQAVWRERAGERWQDHDLVFSTRVGTELDAANVRRSFRNVVKKAELGVVDASRAASQLRLPAVERRDLDRGHLSPGRSRQYRGDSEGVSPGAASGPHSRSRSDGHRLQVRRQERVGRPAVRPAGRRIGRVERRG